jgi:hypothetical protein
MFTGGSGHQAISEQEDSAERPEESSNQLEWWSVGEVQRWVPWATARTRIMNQGRTLLLSYWWV